MSASCAHDHDHGHGHGHGHDHSGHDHGPAGDDPVYRRILVVAMLVNLAMFGVEIVTSQSAMSDALLADSIDFLGDAANYAVSLWVLGAALATRARASLLKAASMAIFGVWVLGSTAMHVLAGNVPAAPTMGVVGALALAANFGVAILLYRFRNGDSNMRSVWLCTRNDAIGNVAVLVAALGVFGTGHGWPDALVAAGMGMLALHSAVNVTRQARNESAPHRGVRRSDAGMWAGVRAWVRARLAAPIADAVVRALDTRPDETVLEIGCGPGEAVRRLVAEGHVRKIVAIDAFAGNVEVARRLNREAIRNRAVDIREGRVSELPFRDGSFDVVFAAGGVTDWRLRDDLEGILRVLKPGGRVLLGLRAIPGGRAQRKIELVLRTLPPAGFVEVTVEEIRRWGLRLLVIGAKRPIWSGGPYDAFVP